jgi:hypothetical protein
MRPRTRSNSPWLWSGLLLLVGAGAVLLSLPETVSPAKTTAQPETEVPASTMTGVALPKTHRKYPPSSRIPMRVPYVGEGIEVGPGQFLPPLNGVKVEDGIPAIRRDPRLPPPGPVVAKVVGPDGQEYWEHEDGSYTSCTYSQIQTADGSTKEIVATQHGAVASRRGQPGR